MKGDYLYCPNCGIKLILKEVKDEGLIPYCENCKELYFPHFNVACSMIIVFEDKTLLIKQYNQDDYILVAGYLNRGESAEDAIKREVSEEVGLEVLDIKILKTKYFLKSNTLMINAYASVKNDKVNKNYEVDSYTWFSFDEALKNIKANSLAKEFYINFYNNYR